MRSNSLSPQRIRDILHAQRIEGWHPRQSEGVIIDRLLNEEISPDQALDEFEEMSHRESIGHDAKKKSWWRQKMIRTPYEEDHLRILRNRPGITSPKALEVHTSRACFTRTIEAFRSGSKLTAPNKVNDVHAALFGDVFSWAGHHRIVNITKRGQHFAVVSRIDEHFELAVKLLEEFDATPDAPFKKRVTLLAGFLTEFLWAHPYRDGNGRTATYYLMERTPPGALSTIDPERWYDISAASLRGEAPEPSPWFDLLTRLLKTD